MSAVTEEELFTVDQGRSSSKLMRTSKLLLQKTKVFENYDVSTTWIRGGMSKFCDFVWSSFMNSPFKNPFLFA